MAETVAPEVVQTLVEQHRRFLAFLERRVGSRAVAEELLQSAFVKAVERGGDVRDDESATAWFYRLLRNALVDFYRHRDAERRALERHAVEAPLADEPDPGLHDAVCECVHGLIPTLKAEYADILRAVEMEGAGLGETAARLGITSGNAAVRLHRARHALRTRLQTACGTCTEHGCLDCTCEQAPRGNSGGCETV
jgi:RNA polymerase sigma-70 factor (ECF subfamily)